MPTGAAPLTRNRRSPLAGLRLSSGTMRAFRLALLFLVVGCTSSGPMSPMPPSPSDQGPTWYKDVAPLVSAHCTGCHKPGGIGPFSLTEYDSAAKFSAAMVAQVQAGNMPPWSAVDTDSCKPRYSWKEDLRLSPAEKELLTKWAGNGAPAGDKNTAAPLPPGPSLDLQDRTQRVSMPASYLVQGARDVYRCFSLPYEFAEDSWLTGLQVVAGNSKIVHHVLVWLDADKKGEALAKAEGSYECFGAPGFDAALLAAWAPGATPISLPPDTALRVPKGSKIVINVHYHPSGQPESDLSTLDLKFSTQKPSKEALLALVGNAPNAAAGLMPGPDDPTTGPAFVIPAGAQKHTEDMQFAVPAQILIPVRLFAVGTHMHYVGTDMRIEIDRSHRLGGAPADEPASECLLETPRWNFHWQRGYSYDADFDKLPTVRSGDVLKMHCLYDNSMQNPFVAAALAEQNLTAPREVRLGEQTLDEMCLGVFGIAVPAR
jgi:hypothetical protein